MEERIVEGVKDVLRDPEATWKKSSLTHFREMNVPLPQI